MRWVQHVDVVQIQPDTDTPFLFESQQVGKFKQELFLTQSKLERAEHSLLETNQKLSRVEKDYVRSQSELLNPNAGKAASKRSPDVSEDQEASAKPGTPSAVAEKDSTAQDKESVRARMYFAQETLSHYY